MEERTAIFPTENATTHMTDYSAAALEWLNAAPKVPDMADLFALHTDDFAIRAVHDIVERPTFDLPAQGDYSGGAWLNHFYFESRNREKVFGTKDLYFGYPMVFFREAGQPVAAPLFLWQVQVEPHIKHADHWSIQHPENAPKMVNTPLFHWLDQRHGTDFLVRLNKLVSTGKLSSRLIAEVSEGVRLLLNLQEDGLPLSVQPCPRPHELERVYAEGCLRWSAVMGIFPTLPRTMDTPMPPAVTDTIEANDWQHNFPLLPLDPSQQSVLFRVRHNPLTVVEGASGSGKTYLISALIINALSNGKKCLVVSKSINSLRRAQKFLLDKGFGDVSFIIRDLAGDQLMLSDMLRAAADNKVKPNFEEDVFRAALNSAKRERVKLDDAWTNLHAPFFGNHSFVDVTGQFLRSNRIENKDLLLSQINPADFEFTMTEYEGIVAAIRSSEPLFLRFPNLRHPLSRLKDQIFVENNNIAAKGATETLVKKLLDQATALHHRYISKTNDYNEALTEHYEQYYNELAAHCKRIRDGIEDGVHRFGADFETASPTVEKLYGVFSDRYKQITAAKETLVEHYKNLRETHFQRRYFEFDFPSGFDPLNIRKTGELVKDFEAALRMWRRRVPAVIREDLRRLNAKSIHQGLDFKEQARELEFSMDVFLEEFNAAGLYTEAVKHEMLTIPKRQEFLEDMIGRLEDTQFYLRDFDDFYIWQKHWLALRPAEQKVVQALCKIKPKNWLAALDSWYLYHILQKEYNPALQWTPESIRHYADAITALNNQLPLQISSLWHNRKNKALRDLRNTDANAFKVWFGKNNRELSPGQKVETLFQKHIETLTETLPVLLVTPDVALDVVQASNYAFDLVLVDEAHNIPKQECYHLFGMAKHLVVFGDPKQDMTPFAQDDFLEYCQTLGAPLQALEYQHQDSPDEWVAFNRIAFNTPFKRLPSVRAAHEVTTVSNVEGRYDENTRTNDAEARQIIDWLNLIEPTPAKTYPAVGIACATVQQRDLIASQLLQIRQRQLPGFEKIQQLYLNGLGVYQFAELQGQHVDILLLSLTHGLIDSNGTLTNHLHFWNTQLGINQLHVALTRATQKVFIAHSIPPGLHTVLASDRNFLGTCILSHLVTFGALIQQKQSEAADEQLQKMAELLHYSAPTYPSHTFSEEVEIALQPYFAPGQIRRNAAANGIIAPILVETSPQNKHVLMVDGVLSKTKHPSYEWEEKVRQYCNRSKIGHIPILSGQWWKSPKQEAKKVASKILLEA
jgi:hypothetical protein